MHLGCLPAPNILKGDLLSAPLKVHAMLLWSPPGGTGPRRQSRATVGNLHNGMTTMSVHGRQVPENARPDRSKQLEGAECPPLRMLDAC
mmetsp:Transcript_44916/g.83837  ORF Transcript_44916/g.83837 Transcript_44916/m.83837 type:complete len:89 (-) Transcript_44916:24-290(-)